jgi:hypothetical protein
MSVSYGNDNRYPAHPGQLKPNNLMTKKSLAIIFSIAAFLRLAFIWVAPAWYDESFTLILSRLPFDRMLAAVAGDVHPPLYYLLIWPLGQLHAPVWVLRIPSALLSLASMWIYWNILLAFEPRSRVRRAALVLMAIMPIQLYYAQEARMYALLEFLVLAAFWAMLYRRWGWFCLAGILMLYTQNYGLFYFATLCLVALIRNFKARTRIFQAGALAGAVYLPWLLVLRSQMDNIQGSYWMQMTGPGMPLRVLFEVLFMPQGNAVLQIPLMLAGYGWLFAALLYALLHRTDNLATTCWMAFLPFGLAVLVSMIWQPVLHYRPLIAISPFLYLLLARPIDSLMDKVEGSYPYLTVGKDGHAICKDRLFSYYEPNWRKTLYAAIFILPLILVCDVMLYAYAVQNKTMDGSQPYMVYIRQHWQPGDIVYHFGDDSWVNMTPYTTDLPNSRAPGCAITKGGLSASTRSAIGMQIVPLEDLTYTRAWLIWDDTPLDPYCSNGLIANLGLDPRKPVLVGIDNEYIYSGLWLLEK